MSAQTLPARRFAGVLLAYGAAVLVLSTLLREQMDAANAEHFLAWLGLIAIPPLYLFAWQWFRASDELQQRIFGESVLITLFVSGFISGMVHVAVMLDRLPDGLVSLAARDLGGFGTLVLWYAVWRWRRWSYR